MEIDSKLISVDESQKSIMGVKFSSDKKYRAAVYTISSNMIEGWRPSRCRCYRERPQCKIRCDFCYWHDFNGSTSFIFNWDSCSPSLRRFILISSIKSV